jgi:hypothetical protein
MTLDACTRDCKSWTFNAVADFQNIRLHLQIQFIAGVTADRVTSRRMSRPLMCVWPHRQCDGLNPQVGSACVHKQDVSCTSTLGNHRVDVRWWRWSLVLIDTANPVTMEVLSHDYAACRLIYVGTSTLVTLMSQEIFSYHIITTLRTVTAMLQCFKLGMTPEFITSSHDTCTFCVFRVGCSWIVVRSFPLRKSLIGGKM